MADKPENPLFPTPTNPFTFAEDAMKAYRAQTSEKAEDSTNKPQKPMFDFFEKTRGHFTDTAAEREAVDNILKVTAARPLEKIRKVLQEELKVRDKNIEDLMGMVTNMAKSIEKISMQNAAIMDALSQGIAHGQDRKLRNSMSEETIATVGEGEDKSKVAGVEVDCGMMVAKVKIEGSDGY